MTKKQRSVGVLACVWAGSLVCATLRAQTPAPTPAAGTLVPAATHSATLTRYCLGCHNGRIKAGQLPLDQVDFTNVPAGAETWEKVLKKLRTGAMPPPGAPRPDRTTYDSLISWLETTIDRAAGTVPDPGHTLLHRLNRAEYANAVRDLLALDVDVAALLPPDDSSYGFDNIADILGVSPALQERYLSAADKISALAIGASDAAAATDTTFQVPADRTQRGHIDGLPLGTRGGILVRHTVPVDGEYIIRP